jgi:hypothetical protein
LATEIDKWVCVEMKVKLNTPGQFDGELELWLDGVSVAKFGDGLPSGKYVW